MNVLDEPSPDHQSPADQPSPASRDTVSLTRAPGSGRAASAGQVRALLAMVVATEEPPPDLDALAELDRDAVGAAVAVLVTENGLRPAEASEVLALLAATDRQELADVARAVVADATERGRTAVRPSD